MSITEEIYHRPLDRFEHYLNPPVICYFCEEQITNLMLWELFLASLVSDKIPWGSLLAACYECMEVHPEAWE